MKSIAFLLFGSGALGLALIEIYASFSDKLGVLARIRQLILGGPEDESDMSAAIFWLELVLLVPIGIVALTIGCLQMVS